MQEMYIYPISLYLLLSINLSLTGSKPSVIKDLPTIGPQPKEGSTLTMNCDFDGTPYPDIWWYKDEQNVTTAPGYTVTDDNRKMTLINMNRKIHAGKYQCIAVNTKGVKRSTLSTIDVTCRFRYCYIFFILTLLNIFSWSCGRAVKASFS